MKFYQSANLTSKLLKKLFPLLKKLSQKLFLKKLKIFGMLASINFYLKKKECLTEMLMNVILIAYIFKICSTEIFLMKGELNTLLSFKVPGDMHVDKIKIFQF